MRRNTTGNGVVGVEARLAGILPFVSLMLLLHTDTSLVCAASQSPFFFPSNTSWFREAKFGLFITWGPVSQWGTEIGFPLVCKQLPCTVQTKGPSTVTIKTVEELQQHRQQYADLAQSFNPSEFDAEAMAKYAKTVGFKYLVFTTEHCDGFANFHSKLSSYNILNTPYKKDIFGMLAKAFRDQGLRVGAYFCPSTWNSDDYWQPNAMTALGPVCRPNYTPASDPERWKNYLKYLLGQLSELATQYSPDIVWIDCSEELNSLDTRVESVGRLFREVNPEVVMQIRGHGGWEDYLETSDKQVSLANSIMDMAMMTAGVHFEVPDTLAIGPWAYSPTVSYHTAQYVIKNLITITAKGGNYLLNLGPGPDGLWPDAGIAVLNEVADWMAINGESIEGTREQWPHDFTSQPEFGTSRRHFVMATPNGTYMYASEILADSDGSFSALNEVNASNPVAMGVCLAFVRNTTLAKTLVDVTLLGHSGHLEYILNASGLWITVHIPSTLAQLDSYWSSVINDTAPCATRGCRIYTSSPDHFIDIGHEGFCNAHNTHTDMIPLSLIYNSGIGDSAMVYNTSNYTSHGYGVVRTECYAYPTKQNGLAAVDLYWNEARKDLWTLASETSRQKAMQQGYVFVATQGYILPMSTPVTHATLKYAYVYRMKFE